MLLSHNGRPPSRLYLLSPPQIDLASFTPLLDQVLSVGDVACFQLRLKQVPDRDVVSAVQELMPVVHRHDVAFILNDRPDLAAQLKTDGVHIGQEDETYQAARACVGHDCVVGVTCHDSRHLAMNAAEAGADYIAFGAFYQTTTKQTPMMASLDLLIWWQEVMEIPCVAIGGITVDTIADIAKAGADFVAVSGGVWAHPDGPDRAIQMMTRACKDAALVA